MRELITEKDMLHSRVIFKKHIAKTNNKKNPVLKKIMEIRKFKKSMTIKKKENNTDEIAFLLSENDNLSTIEEHNQISLESNKNENIISPALSKFWKTNYELPAIYTGGKIIISGKNKQILSISNFTIYITDLEEKELIKKISHENEEISNFALNQQETLLLTFTKNYLLRIIDYQTFDTIKTIKLTDNSFALEMTFDPAGRFLAIGTPQGIIKVFDVKKGIQTHEFKGHKGSIKQIFFYPDFQKYQIISISEEGTIKIFDLIVNACLNTNNTNISFSALTLSEDGSRIFGYDNFKIYMYDLKDLSFIKYFSAPEDFFVISHIKINEQEYLMGGGYLGTIKYLSLFQESEVFQEIKEFKNPNIMNILLMKNKNQIAIVTGEQNVLIFDIKVLNSNLIFKTKETIVGFNDEIIDLKYIKTSKKNKFSQKDLVCMATNSNIIKLFNKKEKKFTMFLAHNDTVLSIDAIDDLLITSSKDKTIKLWKMREKEISYELVATFKGHLESIGCVALSPKTTSFFISGSVDKSIKVWSVKQAMKSFQKQIKISGKKEPLIIANALRSIFAHEKDINALKFSPNEKLFASASQDKSIKIWDSETFATKYILKGHKRGVWDVSFSPFEKILCSASGDSTVKIWNLVDGSCLNTLEGHNGSVLKVNWVCFGLEIVSGGSDGLIKLWNYKKGLCMNTFEKHEGKIWALDISEPLENGKQQMISGGNDSLFCCWEDITVEEEQKIQETNRNMIIEQQNISNALRNRDYYEAGRIAFKNGMVKNFQTSLEFIFNDVEFKNDIIYSEMETLSKPEQDEELFKFEEKFTEFLKEIMEIDVNKLFVFIRDMNSTSKYCKIAQKILYFLFKMTPIQKFKEFREKFQVQQKKKGKIDENIQKKQKEFDELIEVLIAYSDKHMNRTQNFIKKSFYLDFILKKLNLFNFEEDFKP